MSDDERREVAERLRGLTCIPLVQNSLGLEYDEKMPNSWLWFTPESVNRLADLIDPGEFGQNQDRNLDTVQKESPAVQKAPEFDREALLELADKMRKYARLRSSMGMDVDAMAVGAWVLRIREACGEADE